MIHRKVLGKDYEWITHHSREDVDYEVIDLNWFKSWYESIPHYGFDIETEVAKEITGRIPHSMQFGHNDVEVVVDLHRVSKEVIDYLTHILTNDDKLKFIQYALFELSVLQYHMGIFIHNSIWCTHTMEKLITNDGGLHPLSLGALFVKYGVGEVKKSEFQTSFDGSIMSIDQIDYACLDTRLEGIAIAQRATLADMNYSQAGIDLQNKYLPAASDFLVNGFTIDEEKWRDNIEWAKGYVSQADAELKQMFLEDIKPFLIENGYYVEETKLSPIWSTVKGKMDVHQLLYPEIKALNVKALKPYAEDPVIIKYREKDYFSVAKYLIAAGHKDFLIENGYFYLKDTFTPEFNLSSDKTLLKVMQQYIPEMSAVNKDERDKYRHVHHIVDVIEDYKTKLKLTSTYGEDFLNKRCSDGKIRIGKIDVLLATGRISTAGEDSKRKKEDKRGYSPQQIPAKALPRGHNNRYRNCFYYEENGERWKILDADFDGQELCIMAVMCQEQKWLDCLHNGWDIHSVSAHNLLGEEWEKLAEPDCLYMSHKEKCDCTEHKEARSDAKTINFGIPYGMGSVGLAAKLKSSNSHAVNLLKKYFKGHPNIDRKIKELRAFAVDKGYSETMPPFHTRRYYDYADKANHLFSTQGDKYWLNKLERAAGNQPIQGTASDQTKYASIIMRKKIHENGWQHVFKPLAPVHDQLVSAIKPDNGIMTDQQASDLKKWAMEEAGRVTLGCNLLKTSPQITWEWQK